MRWTIVIVAIFVLVAMVTSNVVPNNNMEVMNPMGGKMFPNGEQVVEDSGYLPPMSKRYWVQQYDWRREEWCRHHRCWY
ncbi:unnamed protein product [Adineta steineri]|uniref:Uncharacterized protein n=1 Tax=Adineta steineri TaxID=433720 RepID=A0A815DAD1_9BILA|nr:unnamed protein product [Adineta steineri]CAF1295133.1 unnamed protein product [Adineta steineri]CAF4135022.1 unnamed protein product [Adineta steineri]CAF4159729.1 unnamed protein product [Adineta steineri]